MTESVDPPLSPRATLRWSVARRIVGELRPGTILEVGCGLGGVGVRLARMAAYTAVEPDDRSFTVARDRIAPVGGTVIHGDHNKVPVGTTYDLVCAFEVLEHIADDAAALADWLPLVRPGGHLLLSVPADPERFGASDVLAGHYRRYTATQLRERLTGSGATDVTLRHYGWPLSYVLDSVRNRLSRDKVGTAAATAEERSHTSGRLFQPRSPLVGGVIRLGVAPFVLLQAARPKTGPDLIAVARRPESAGPAA
jgi:SAM-dependent methyltransferase